MKIKLISTFFIVVFALISCKSEFEKIRSGGDAAKMLEAADKYYAEEEWQKAQTLYELIVGSYRGQKEAEDIYFNYSYTYYYLGRYLLASYYFKNFATTFGGSTKKEEAEYMIAYSYYQLSPTFRLDQTNTEKAIESFQSFINTYTQSPRVEQCNRLIDELRLKLEEKAFEGGKLYFDLRQYQSAIQTFENLLKDFPETPNAEEVRYMSTRAAYLLAENSFVERQQERYQEAEEKAEEFLGRYKEGRFVKEVQGMLDNSKKKLNQLDNVRYQNSSARSGS
ncbi:MAG: outer membrane protein assembly factor BamD [Saprospiraceae bacterium]